MFLNELEKISWEEMIKIIYSKTDADVRHALSKEHCDVNDSMVLISPATAPYLETMARLSRKYTLEHFRKTTSMFVPLHVMGSCTNPCVYCDFNHSNPMKWTILTKEEMINEYKMIKKLAPFEDLLLVTDENPAKAGADYTERAPLLARPYFSNLQIEVMPPRAEKYRWLTCAGLNGVTCFQKTCNKANCNVYHPCGMKSKFKWRVNNFDRMGQTGAHRTGMGVLIDLEEWRMDVIMMAYHLRYPQKYCWRAKYSVNLPRTCSSESKGFQPNVIMSNRELAWVTFAIRIFGHGVDISYSTRESAGFRNRIVTLGVATMNTESKMEPEGYFAYSQTLEQFRVSDERGAVEVDAALRPSERISVCRDQDTTLVPTRY